MHSIPPGVVGERQGQLTLVVDEIIWLVELDSPGRVKAEWWGSRTDHDVCGLYSSVAERQSCKLKVLGSIPSGGFVPSSC